MIEIIYSMEEWQAYINSTLYASAKTLKALIAYLNAHVPEIERQVVINFGINFGGDYELEEIDI